MRKPSRDGRTDPGVGVRGLRRRDRPRIEEIVVASGKFNKVEIATALELVDEALERGAASGYLFALLEQSERPPRLAGYACFGPAPLTQGVYDLYWIAVDPAAQGKGLGRHLLASVERDVTKRGGRMLLIETSSQPAYAGAVRFYRRSGYRQAARIRDFYRIGDDKLVFLKRLSAGADGVGTR